jgi:DNA-binding winged helix-turn-helix (wHTH) protein
MIYRFGEFTLDARNYLLTRDDDPQRLTPAVYRLLLFLIENAGDIVTKEAMLNRLWPDEEVEEGNLARHISVLRKLLGERPGQHEYIHTIRRVGYRFVPEVTRSIESRGQLLVRVAPHSRAPIPGRQRERGRLRFAFHSAAAGSGSMILIAGESGVGKTNLVEEFLFEIGQTEGLCRIARGRCLRHQSGNRQYSALMEAFESFEGAARFAVDLPAFIRNVCQVVPLVLFLDDLHWMDEPTATLLAAACSRLGSQKMLVIGAYRPAGLSPHDALCRLKSEMEDAGWLRELRLHSIASPPQLSDGIGHR